MAVLEADLQVVIDRWASADEPDEVASRIRRFGELIDETPTLQTAFHGMCERLAQVAAQMLAERAGVDPDDPEPQLVASVVLALWMAQQRAMHRYADGTRSVREVHEVVLDEIHRAARVADTGLSSFNLVVHQGASSRQQLRDAAVATNEARKQVLAAVKQARDAWKLVVAEAKAQHQAYHQADEPAGPTRSGSASCGPSSSASARRSASASARSASARPRCGASRPRPKPRPVAAAGAGVAADPTAPADGR